MDIKFDDTGTSEIHKDKLEDIRIGTKSKIDAGHLSLNLFVYLNDVQALLKGEYPKPNSYYKEYFIRQLELEQKEVDNKKEAKTLEEKAAEFSKPSTSLEEATGKNILLEILELFG